MEGFYSNGYSNLHNTKMTHEEEEIQDKIDRTLQSIEKEYEIWINYEWQYKRY